jgi:hypothetical protein
MKKTLFVLAVVLALCIHPAVVLGQARIELFSPTGTVKGVRQATARFSEQMVSFGDPRLGDPFEVLCPEKGKGRWIDGKNWSFDFDRDLPAGIVCEFRLKPDVKTLAGQDITGNRTFGFSTGGPAVKRSRPYEGSHVIDEEQIFILTLDAMPQEESILKNVYFSVEGVMERVGIRIIQGKDREDILAAVYPGRQASAKKRAGKPGHRIAGQEVEDSQIVLLQARQRFPASAVVKLVWGAGVTSASGVATTQDQVLSYKVREPFRAEFTCSREKPGVGCIPVLPMQLYFTATVQTKIAKQILLKSKSGSVWKPVLKSQEDEKFIWNVTFTGPFPEATEFTISVPEDLKDEAGRPLANLDKFPLKVSTHSDPPLAKFASRFGIIESQGDALLPVTVRNIEASIKTRVLRVEDDFDRPDTSSPGEEVQNAGDGKGEGSGSARLESGKIIQQLKGKVRRISADRDDWVIEWLQKVAAAERSKSIFERREAKEVSIPKPGGDKAFEVMGMPLGGAGFYVVELESLILGERLLGDPVSGSQVQLEVKRKVLPAPPEKQTSGDPVEKKPRPMFIPTAALVTNLSAHFKWGRESSLVWVTTLDEGSPVAAADITIRDCNGKAVWKGKTDESGIALIKGELESPYCKREHINYSEASHALRDINSGLFVFARTGGDMTFTHSSWEEGIEPWRFQLPRADGSRRGNIIAHTVLDRTLFRAGESVSMKHFVRSHTTAGFKAVPAAKRPDEVMIEHQGSEERYGLPIVWRDNGIAESTWKIPENAKLGTYSIVLGQKNEKVETKHYRRHLENAMTSGSFRVEEFRVPLMKGILQGSAQPLVKPKAVDVDLFVSYLAGGGASGLPVKLRAELHEKHVTVPGFEDYSFAGGPLSEGAVRRSAMHDDGSEEEEGAESPRPAASQKFATQDLRLDRAGSARARLSGIPEVTSPKDIHAEMEFRDTNGEVKTAAAKIAVYPAARLIGIKPDSWALSSDLLKYRVAVVDLKGKPVADADAAVDLYQEKTISHRVRLVGGFYAYRHATNLKRIETHCSGQTDRKGMLICEGKSPISGSVILHAQVKDEDGNTASANYTVWVAGKDDWWFKARNDDRIDVLPETKRYEPGDTARFQVRMPFRAATALVTVEREGIVDVFTQKLTGQMPIVEVPVKSHYAPNVFVSVLVVRGRTGDAKPTATFDPGKPAYRIGIGEIKVGWKGHELKVEVIPDKKVFRIREQAQVHIKVRKADGGLPPKNSEIAVAAVDEGLLQLMPNESWKLLDAMMRTRGYEVRTSTAQAMVVGKRHFGLKALPHGGGGGRQLTRELFDTLLVWKGRVVLDDRGEAAVKIPLNDSLTSFRIVAIASGGIDLFGTGDASIRSTKDLMLLAGIPQLVREGDRLQAGFTVRNASDRPMDVEASLSVGGKQKKPLDVFRESIPAGAAREIRWAITVPHDIDKLEYEAEVREKGGVAFDRVKVSQKVIQAVPVRTFQATLTQIRGEFRIEVEKPADAVPGRGGINVQVKPTVLGSLAGVREYMQEYPYTCLEQKISVAVALRDKSRWQALMKSLPPYLDPDGLLKYFPSMPQGSDVLTAHVLSIAQEAGYEVPAYSLERMMSGMKGFIGGRVIRFSALPTADLAIRKIAAVEALSRYETVGNDLLSSIPIEPNLWPTSAVAHWIGILSRGQDIRDQAIRMQEAREILRSRFNLQGTTLGLSEERPLWWLMDSPDGMAAKAIIAALPFESWHEDIPRMVTWMLSKLRRGHWDTTVANAWGVLAMEKFSGKYENAPVTGTLRAGIGKNIKTFPWRETPGGRQLKFNWPQKKETLSIRQDGTGAPWTVVRSMAAVPLKTPLSSGYKIKKTVVPLEQKEKGKWKRGDLLRVRLEMAAQSDMTWVVVNDPIPAGSSILRADMGGSAILTAREKRAGWVQEAFTERSFEAFRVYYEYVPKGEWSTEYTLRLNNEGVFRMPATRAEALYAPEMFGEIPNRDFEVISDSGK